MENKQIVLARVPVELECTTPLIGGDEVFEGEYEVPYFGDQLTILDLGANIGSFALWATLRWPQSRIHCHEPHSGTFEILRRNVGALENVTCVKPRHPADGQTARRAQG